MKTTLGHQLKGWQSGQEIGLSGSCNLGHSHEEITGGFRNLFSFHTMLFDRYLLKLAFVFLGGDIPGFKIERSKKVKADHKMA